MHTSCYIFAAEEDKNWGGQCLTQLEEIQKIKKYTLRIIFDSTEDTKGQSMAMNAVKKNCRDMESGSDTFSEIVKHLKK